MTIDASIPLQVRTPQIDDPMNAVGRAMALRQMQTQTALGDEQLAKAQKVRDLSRQANGSPATLKDLLAKEGYFEESMALGNSIAEQEKTGLQIDNERLKKLDSMFKIVAPALASLGPNPSLEAVHATVNDLQAKGVPADASRLPKTQEEVPSWIQQSIALGQTVENAIKTGDSRELAKFLQEAQGQQQATQPTGSQPIISEEIDPASGAVVRPLAPVDVPMQGPQAGQSWNNNAPAMPGTPGAMRLADENVIDKPPVDTPDQFRRKANEADALVAKLRAKGTPEFLAHAEKLSTQAKEWRAYANQLDGRAIEDQKLEDSRANREEQAKGRQAAADAKKIDVANKFRDDFVKASKVYVDTRDAFTRIRESARDPSAAGDLAMIFNYMKLLDPGSVVREGEFATAQNAAGVPDRVRNMFNRALTGERLEDKQRADFVDRANRLYSSMEKNQQKLEAQYRGMARRAGIDVRDVIVDYRPFDDGAKASGKPKQSIPPVNKQGWKLHTDAQGNKAYVSPDGKQFEEVR